MRTSLPQPVAGRRERQQPLRRGKDCSVRSRRRAVTYWTSVADVTKAATCSISSTSHATEGKSPLATGWAEAQSADLRLRRILVQGKDPSTLNQGSTCGPPAVGTDGHRRYAGRAQAGVGKEPCEDCPRRNGKLVRASLLSIVLLVQRARQRCNTAAED